MANHESSPAWLQVFKSAASSDSHFEVASKANIRTQATLKVDEDDHLSVSVQPKQPTRECAPWTQYTVPPEQCQPTAPTPWYQTGPEGGAAPPCCRALPDRELKTCICSGSRSHSTATRQAQPCSGSWPPPDFEHAVVSHSRCERPQVPARHSFDSLHQVFVQQRDIQEAASAPASCDHARALAAVPVTAASQQSNNTTQTHVPTTEGRFSLPRLSCYSNFKEDLANIRHGEHGTVTVTVVNQGAAASYNTCVALYSKWVYRPERYGGNPSTIRELHRVASTIIAIGPGQAIDVVFTYRDISITSLVGVCYDPLLDPVNPEVDIYAGDRHITLT